MKLPIPFEESNTEQQAHVLWAEYDTVDSENRFWRNYQRLIAQAKQQQSEKRKTQKQATTTTQRLSGPVVGRFAMDMGHQRKNVKQLLILLFATLIGFVLLNDNQEEMGIFISCFDTDSVNIGSTNYIPLFWFWCTAAFWVIRYFVQVFNARQLMIEVTPKYIIRYQGMKETSKVELKSIGVMKEGRRHLVIFTEGVTSGLEHNFEKQVVRVPKGLDQYEDIKYYLGQLTAQKRYV